MIDFGSAGNDSSILGPGHVSNGGVIADSDTTWTLGAASDGATVADLADGSVFSSDGSGALSGVSVNFGVGSDALIDYASQPFARTGVSGARSGTGVFNNTTFRDFFAATNSNGTPTTAGMAISGLAAGEYAVWVIVRHTYQNNDSMASDDYDIWAGAGNTLTAPNSLASASIQQYNRDNALANTATWAVGEGYTWVQFSTTLTSGQDLLIFSESAFDNQNGIINAVQIAAVPEPGTYALMLGLLAFAGILIRRRVRQ
jgi:hypothetical protein